MGAAASSGQLPEVVDLDAAKSAYALEGYDLDVPRWQKIAEPKGGTLPRAEALRYGPLTKDALQDLMPADVAWSPKLDKRFANMSFGPEEKAAITRADAGALLAKATAESAAELKETAKPKFRRETRDLLAHLKYFMDHRARMDQLFAEVSPEGAILEHVAFDLVKKPATGNWDPLLRQQRPAKPGRPADGVVDTLADVYEAASLAKKVFDAKLESMRGAVGLPEGALVLPPLKGAARAAEKAANDYGSRDPGPGFAWLMDIVRASIVVDTEDQVLAILNHFPKRRGAPAADAGSALLGGNADADGDGDDDGVPDVEMIRLKNRFATPMASGFRDMNMLLRCKVHAETDAFFFVCELQIHHAGLRKAEKASKSHEVYEFFRTYFRGGEEATVRRRFLLLEKVDHVLRQHGEDFGAAIKTVLADDDEDATVAFAELVGLGGDADTAAAILRTDARRRVNELHAAAKLAVDGGARVDAALEVRAADALARYAAAAAETNRGAAAKALRRCLRLREKALGPASFAVGDASDALATLCDDEADAVAFLRTALAIRRREGDGAKVGQTLHNLAGHVAAAARGDDAKLRDALELYRQALQVRSEVWGSRSDKVASTLYGAASVLADLGHGDAARGALERCLSIYEKSLGADHPRAVDAKLKLATARRAGGDLAGALDVAHAAAAARAAAAAHDDEDAAARADLASALLSVASLLNALDADRVADVLPGAAGNLAAEPVDALLGRVHALDPDGAAPAAAAPKTCHPSLAIHAAPAGGTVEVPAPLEAVVEEETSRELDAAKETSAILESLKGSLSGGAKDAGLDVADEAERTYAPGDDAGRGGKIRVEAWLASGAEGDVYRVADADMGPLAMKVVKAARSENRDAKLVALCAETATFARVGAACPFVVSLRYATVSGPEFASFVDLVEGPPLGDLLAAGGLADGDLLSLAEQLGKGLAHVHGRGVIHSDVKPDNLLVGRSGGALHLRITDFGLAATAPEPTADAVGRALAGAAAAADGGLEALTMDALRGCTRKYASPEIATRWAAAGGGGSSSLAASSSSAKGGAAPPSDAPLTPATSDNWAAALTVFELFASGSGAMAWPGGGEHGLAALEAYAAKPTCGDRAAAVRAACGDRVFEQVKDAPDPFRVAVDAPPVEVARYHKCRRSYRPRDMPAALLAHLRAALAADPADRPPSASALAAAAAAPDSPAARIEAAHPATPPDAYVGLYNNCGNALAELKEPDKALVGFYRSLALGGRPDLQERTLSNAAACLRARATDAEAAAGDAAAERREQAGAWGRAAEELRAAAVAWRERLERVLASLRACDERRERPTSSGGSRTRGARTSSEPSARWRTSTAPSSRPRSRSRAS